MSENNGGQNAPALTERAVLALERIAEATQFSAVIFANDARLAPACAHSDCDIPASVLGQTLDGRAAPTCLQHRTGAKRDLRTVKHKIDEG